MLKENRILYGLIVLTLCFFGTSAFAYSVPTHNSMSALAVNKFIQCFPESKIGINQKSVLNAFISGVVHEDEDLITKGLNWHFHHPHKDLGDSFYFGQRSIKFRYQSLIHNILYKGIEFQHDKNEIAFSLGQIVHYLQDMTCPPHVIPIFHTSNDSFDQYELSKSQEAELLNEITCEDLHQEYKAQNFNQKIDTIALDTLQMLNKEFIILEDGRSKKINWTWFWDGVLESGFGYYGVLKNNFGSGQICLDKNCSKKIEVDNQDYLLFARTQQKKSIKATLYALMWLNFETYFHHQ